MIAEIGRRFRALPRAARWRWGSLAPLGLASALLEALAGALVFALLAAMLDPRGVRAGGGIHALASRLAGPDSASSLVTLAAWAAGIHIGKNVLVTVTTWWRSRLVARDSAALSASLLRHYLAAPWSFHLQRSSAALMEILRGSTRPFFEVFEATALVLTEIAVIAALGLVAIAVAPVAVTVAALVIAALVAAIVRVTREAQRRGGERSVELGTALYRHIQYGLGAAKELTVLGRGAHFADAFEHDARAGADLDTSRALLDSLPRLALETAFVAGMLALVVAGALSGSASSVVPLVTLYAYAGFRVLPAAHRITLQMNNLRWSLAASAPVAEELRSASARHSRDRRRRDGAGARMPFRRELRADGVSFRYPGAEHDVLSGVDLTIAAGESVAIVGATGAGKTTLVDVLIGLLEPTSGSISVDGAPIAGRAEEWQAGIGYVPQQPFLLDDTVRRNIALGLPDAEVDDDCLARAVALARLGEVIARLPHGRDGAIGENGCQLSGGERQRIAIARALYRDPVLVVLDEAMSALDPATERAIAAAIDRLRGTRTLIVVTHRPSTAERCDRVLLMDGGRIAASGGYHELLRRSGAFRALVAHGEHGEHGGNGGYGGSGEVLTTEERR